MKVEAAPRVARVALVGNPNTGKSTLFNRLTGLRQRVANYPGVTVEKKTGFMWEGVGRFEVVDLPGCYSLAVHSPDEQVISDELNGRFEGVRPDVVVCVADATNLRRNLFLVTQLAELGLPMVLALNQWDVVVSKGVKIDCGLLEERLGIPVVPVSARTGEGVEELRRAVGKAVENPRYAARVSLPDYLVSARDSIRCLVHELGRDVTEAEALRLIFDVEGAAEAGLAGNERLKRELVKARGALVSRGLNPTTAEAGLIYRHLDRLLEGVVSGGNVRWEATEGIDAILLHRFWGTVIFLGVMYLVFQSLYAWAGPLMDLIDSGVGYVQEMVGPWLEPLPMVQSLVVDGILAGAGGVLVFLPQILILFLFIALLEDSGYLARAAFLMDKLLGWCGLNGKSFVPLLSGFACAIPGVMSARILEDSRARITTVLMTPFMSCSARLPVYVLMIGTFVEPVYGPIVSGWVLFGMHFVGGLVAMPFAWLLNRVIWKARSQPFILEMPPYRVPLFRNVVVRMWERGREFVVRAGTVILLFSIVIWALLYFPRSENVVNSLREQYLAAKGLEVSEVQAALDEPESELSLEVEGYVAGRLIEQSYLGRFGKWVQPVFALAGFDWKITVGVLSSFPAREVIIAMLGIIYNLGSDVSEESEDLREILSEEKWTEGPLMGRPVFTLPVVFAIMVFFALCMQCGATVAVIGREIGWSWAFASFAGMTVLAWVGAVLVYQVGSLFL